MRELGRLHRVDDLRSVWEHEARDFTPWLRDNIELLAEAVGLELDLVETESPVGEYAVDLYAKDLNTGRWVVIENQLEQTDHTHLGQLMAYAAGKEAGVTIWISPTFTDAHRQALDWLNEITDESRSFFGIELELLQIDGSLPAPHFKIVAQPNEWQKTGGRPPATSRQQAYQAFFSELLDKVKAKHPSLTRARKAQPQSWFSYPVGRTGFAINVSFGRGQQFRASLYIDVGDRVKNKAAYNALYEDRQDIEAAVGHELIWERLDDRQASWVYVVIQGSIDDSPAQLQRAQEWAVDLVWKFRQAFGPRVQALEL